MEQKSTILFIFFLSFFIFLFSIAESFDLSCEAGGPYAKNLSTNNTFIIFGNSTNPLGPANVTVNISIGTTKYAEQNLTADDQGYYYSAINTSLDVGTYNVNVSAERNGTYVFCNDVLTVQLSEILRCVDKVITISGISTYTHNGQPISSGTITGSIPDAKITNSTSFSGGSFRISLSGCMEIGRRYLVQLIAQDQTNKIGYSYIIITG